MLFEAIEFATKAHSGQYRKTTKVPYIIHPLGVVKILIDYGCREEVVAAGVLHDTVEDTDVTLGEIHSHFGKNIKSQVFYEKECTHFTHVFQGYEMRVLARKPKSFRDANLEKETVVD